MTLEMPALALKRRLRTGRMVENASASLHLKIMNRIVLQTLPVAATA